MIGFLSLMDVSILDFYTHEALFDPVFLPRNVPDRLWPETTVQNSARQEEAETLQCAAIRWHDHQPDDEASLICRFLLADFLTELDQNTTCLPGMQKADHFVVGAGLGSG